MKKVLLIRFSSIGDIVLTTPVIKAIKNQLNCELHILTKIQYADLTKNNPHVEKVYTINDNFHDVIGKLQAEAYDHVVDLQKNLRSLKVRRKLGRPSSSFPKLNREKWMLVNFKIDKLPHLHIVDRYFEAVSILGVNNDGLGLEYFIPENEEVDVSTLGKSHSEGFIGFVIGSRHETKMLPARKAAEVINKLNFPIILLGGPEDRKRGEEIVALTTNKKVINTCGSYSINQSASLVKQSAVVITNDTGLMHIAAAFEKPIVSVWGNTVPEFGMYPYMPGNYNQSFLAEVRDLKCRPCSKLGFNKCPKKHFKCMMEQDTDTIVSKVEELFKGGKQ